MICHPDVEKNTSFHFSLPKFRSEVNSLVDFRKRSYLTKCFSRKKQSYDTTSTSPQKHECKKTQNIMVTYSANRTSLLKWNNTRCYQLDGYATNGLTNVIIDQNYMTTALEYEGPKIFE